ncbi:sigma-70 family RNA polymerase sigma factor [Reichenbachiella carrageenanivorans]|uniref:Sigma-70 family RNA polymerase sigma factor n=1 Tax=Reichenbachiella carrageenanivorans TaxID=2979869 RepID=A0ABY6CZZ4_9BACT|nr:sigma-70 family RNA polymerase sigma factor [Reichenbachiella carrageenanivorans]UXX78388.1 sigma-70 family RNA polymerase sigma factor [Reichenbachiella carrageenanivorans]
MVIKIGRNNSESELIRQCKRQDRRAQRWLYEQQAPVMLTVCRRYIGDADMAEELMISGFAKVFAKLDQYQAQGSFQGWIRRIMVTTCLEWIRKNRQLYKEVDLDEINPSVDYETVDHHLEAEDLMQVITQLPQGYRTIFNLYAIEGYSHQEIADQLGLSVNTSKSQLSRARQWLQKQLAQQEIKQRDNGS